MSGFISSSTIEQTRSSADIVDVIQRYLPLQRAGASYKARCPFHDEKTPSFNVNPQKQIFYCFGCQKGGDVFRFVSEYEGIPFPEAVERLAKSLGIPIEYTHDSDNGASRSQRERLLRIHEKLAAHWHEILLRGPEAEPARAYIAERQIADASVKAFQIGFSPNRWDHVAQWGRSQKFAVEDLIEGGLVIRKENEGRVYDRFRGRLMFPIRNPQGQVVGFSARVLPGSDDPGGKYINSPETPLFKKSKLLYAFDKARPELLKTKKALICEGQLDTIACHAAGIQYAIAPQGTALVEGHAHALKRYVNEVVFCFDSDTAGLNAVTRSAQILLNQEIAVSVATLPESYDPDGFIREHGKEAFLKQVTDALPYVDFFLNYLTHAHDPRTEKGQFEILRRIGEYLQSIQSSILIDQAIQKLAYRLSTQPAAIRADLKRVSRAPTRPPQDLQSHAGEQESQIVEETYTPPHTNETWILKLLFHESPDPIALCLRWLDPDWIQSPTARRLVESRLQDAAEGVILEPSTFLEGLKDPLLARTLSESLADEAPILEPTLQTQDTLRALRNRFIDQRIRELALQASQLDDNTDCLTELERLRQIKRSPLESEGSP